MTTTNPSQVKPAVLLSDISMPKLDGYRLIQKVQALLLEQVISPCDRIDGLRKGNGLLAQMLSDPPSGKSKLYIPQPLLPKIGRRGGSQSPSPKNWERDLG